MSRLSDYEVSRILYFECLDKDILTEEHIRSTLSQHGKIIKVQFYRAKQRDRQRGYVTFDSPSSRDRAVDLHDPNRVPRFLVRHARSDWLDAYEPPPVNTLFKLPPRPASPAGTHSIHGSPRSSVPGRPMTPSRRPEINGHASNSRSIEERLRQDLRERERAYDALFTKYENARDDLERLEDKLANVRRDRDDRLDEVDNAVKNMNSYRVQRDDLRALLGREREQHAREKEQFREKSTESDRETKRLQDQIVQLERQLQDSKTLLSEKDAALENAYSAPRDVGVQNPDVRMSSPAGEEGELLEIKDAIMEPNPASNPLSLALPDRYVQVAPSLAKAYSLLEELLYSSTKSSLDQVSEEPNRKKRKLDSV